MEPGQDRPPLLEVRDLCVEIAGAARPWRAVDNVGFEVRPGETLGIVGESGCGKSLTALSILRLHPDPPVRIVSGEALFEGRDLLAMGLAELRALRGHRIAMIFQEPMAALNPVMTIGGQIVEVLRRHLDLSTRQAHVRAVELLARVRIGEPEAGARSYPHELSGGMRQRAMIAMALACEPSVLIADEPTTALDVTVQAQILDLIAALRAEAGSAMILITHNLGIVAQRAHNVLVMYAGRAVERAPVAEIFARPLHPYTRGLMGAIPGPPGSEHMQRLAEIPGSVPGLGNLPAGCAFADRCPLVIDRCRREAPPLEFHGSDHRAACWQATVTLHSAG